MGGKRHSEEMKAAIVTYWQNNHQNPDWQWQKVAETFSVPKNTVRSIIEKFRKRGTVENDTSKHRQKSTTPRMDRLIVLTCKRNPHFTIRQIKNEIESNHPGHTIGRMVISRRLIKAGLIACRPRKVPLLRKPHRRARVLFAKTHRHKGKRWVDSLLWSDECQIKLFGHNDAQFVRRPIGKRMALDPRYTKTTVKHGGGSIMVWGCMSTAGTGGIHLIKGTMDSKMYIQIIKKHVKASAAKLGMGRRFIFQQDNDSKHTAGITRKFFKAEKMEVLTWPSQSPDLNVIENAWEVLKRKVRLAKPKNLNELWSVVEREWANLSADYCANLTKNYCQNRLGEVIKAKGYSIDY